jgi:hypothetical protein
MQSPSRLSIKLFAENPAGISPETFVPIFQRWIQENAVEGLLIDVADYKHVFHGPGVILIGHDGDYAYDLEAGNAGLLYTLKQPLDTLEDSLQTALRRVLSAAETLQADVPNLNLSLQTLQIKLIDRPRPQPVIRGLTRNIIVHLQCTDRG